MKKLSTLFFSVAMAMSLGLVACGGSEGDDNSSSMSSQTCKSTHDCINGACQCTTDGKSGNSCEEDDCEADCRVCS